MILKKGWFSDLEILEICKQVNWEEYEQNPPHPNRNTKYWKTRASLTQLNHKIQKTKTPHTLLHKTNDNATRRQNKCKVNKKNITGYCFTFPWEPRIEKIKIENEKINKLLPNIPVCNFTELNKLIYAGAKLVCDKIRVPLSNLFRTTKPGWEIRLEWQVRKDA